MPRDDPAFDKVDEIMSNHDALCGPRHGPFLHKSAGFIVLCLTVESGWASDGKELDIALRIVKGRAAMKTRCVASSCVVWSVEL